MDIERMGAVVLTGIFHWALIPSCLEKIFQSRIVDVKLVHV